MRRAAFALFLALAAAIGAAPGAQADLVYVLNSGDSSISVIDSVTRQEVRRIPVLREPHHLMMSRDNRELMVADSAANEMLWLNPDTADVIRRERISNPYHLGYSPDGKYLVVNSLRRGQVDIYLAEGTVLLARLPAPTQPSHMAFSPDSRFVYITLQGTRSLMAVDLNERRTVWTAEVGPQPAGVLWLNGRLLVGVMGGDYVTVLDPATQQVERRIPTARGSHTVWLSPDGRTVYANSRVDSAITLIDAETLAVRGRWDLPGGPDDIAYAPDGKLWVTLRWIARVAIIDPRDGSYETIRVGRSPHGVLVHPTPGRELVVTASTTPPALPAQTSATTTRVALAAPVAAPAPPVMQAMPPATALPVAAPALVPDPAPVPPSELAMEPLDLPPLAPSEGLGLRAPSLVTPAQAAQLLPPGGEDLVGVQLPPSVSAVAAAPLAPYHPVWWRRLTWR